LHPKTSSSLLFSYNLITGHYNHEFERISKIRFYKDTKKNNIRNNSYF